jgi:hypothetical protein
MGERPRFTDNAATILSEMVDEMAQRFHDLGYKIDAFVHTTDRWQDCAHPYCLATKMKAMTVLRDDDPLGLGEVSRVVVIPPNGGARGMAEALPPPATTCTVCGRGGSAAEAGRYCLAALSSRTYCAGILVLPFEGD